MTDLSSIAKDGSDAAYESALSEVIRNRDLATQTRESCLLPVL